MLRQPEKAAAAKSSRRPSPSCIWWFGIPPLRLGVGGVEPMQEIKAWDGGAVDDGTINHGTLGYSGSGQRYKEIRKARNNGASDSG